MQLANNYTDFCKKKKFTEVDYFWASAKLNGIRCKYTYATNTLTSKTGKPIRGFDELQENLQKLCKKYRLAFVDGELYKHGMDFGDLLSIVNSHEHEEKKNIPYIIFYVQSNKGWYDTKSMIEFMYDVELPEKISFIYYWRIRNNLDDIESSAKSMVQKGFEGIMLRHIDIAYVSSRTDYLLKYKPFIESDFRIAKIERGKGKYDGVMGGIVVEGKYKGRQVRSNVGGGYKDQGLWSREWFWKNKGNVVGKKMEVIFDSLVEKPSKDGFYKFRFSRFSKMKN